MAFRIVLLTIAAAACAGPRAANKAGAEKPPPRPPTCDLAIHHTPTPGVLAWDDLGVAEVTCHINIGLPQCMRQFRTEACRMGGDIVYAMPEIPLRPREQAIVYRARVAHTRPAPPSNEQPTVSATTTSARPQPPPPAAAAPTAATVPPSPSIVETPTPDAGTIGVHDR